MLIYDGVQYIMVKGFDGVMNYFLYSMIDAQHLSRWLHLINDRSFFMHYITARCAESKSDPLFYLILQHVSFYSKVMPPQTLVLHLNFTSFCAAFLVLPSMGKSK
jgi:hypothetical protein